MKHIFTNLKIAVWSTVIFFGFLITENASAQANAQSNIQSVSDPIYGDSLDGFNLSRAIAKAHDKGLNARETTAFIVRCKRSYVDRKYELPVAQKNTDLAAMRIPNQVAMTPCTNMDFETGNFTGWTGFIGDNTVSSNGPLQNINPGIFTTGMDALLSDMNARHTIVSAASGNDMYGGFPCVFPGGNYSVRLGNTYANYQGEALEQTFTVGAANTSFTYSYAVVLNDGGHSAGEQPYFRIEMFDQSNNLIPCAQYYVEAAGGNTPGFTPSAIDPWTYYSPWNTVNVDLTAYMASTVTVRFTASGCIYGGHFGYAYIDASCFPYTIAMSDSLCQGSAITLTAPVGATAYLWSTGATTQAITVNSAGSYSVDMTSVTGCHTTLTRNVFVYAQPTAAFNPTSPACSMSYTFNNTSSISNGSLNYYWDFGDPNLTNDTSNVASPTYTYTTPGQYTVTLIVTSNNGCADTITQIVNPGSAGLAAFNSTTVCVGQSTNFTDQSTNPTSWNWNFGDPPSGANDSANTQNATHTFTAAGTYNVTLTVGGNPCPSTLTQSVIVNPLPTPAFVFNQVCGGQLVNFTSTSTVAPPDAITSTSWNFGDPASGPNNTSALSNPSHTFSAPGNYTITLTVNTTNGCPQTITQNVSVGLSAIAAFTATAVCTNSPMQFTNTSANGNSYFWDFGTVATNDTSNVQNPSFTYATAGTYVVTLIANPGPCSDTATLSVTVAPGPQVQFTAPAVCIGTNSSFTDQSTIASGSITNWSWNFGVAAITSDTSNLQNPSYAYTTAGSYVVTLTCTSNNGCQTTTNQNVTVNPQPTANFSSVVVCANSPTNLTDLSIPNSGTITNWSWDFGDGSPLGNTQNPVHTYTNDTTYQVTLIVTNTAGCIDTIVLPVVTASIPNVQFIGDSLQGCPVHCVNFLDQTTIASGSITGWTWDFGDGSPNSFTQNPSHCYITPGTYPVTLTATSNGGCATTLNIPNYITVHPVPVASFSATPPSTTVTNTNINFTDLSQGNPVAWSWNFGDGTTLSDTSSMQNPSYEYSQEYGSNYTVTLVVNNQFGCTDDTSLEVIVEPEFTFYIPNAFTPNGDGINDGFYGTGIGITSYNIWIFDRWGNLIFQTNDMNQAWDGTVQGKSGTICQEDVYVWKVQLTDVWNKKHKYIGHVSLIK
ncbi:MAG: PKD domain-containing protein [Bacteroidetes bacterium]|nr:PKD domain-containing protein [Bacteroidota bacterium]